MNGLVSKKGTRQNRGKVPFFFCLCNQIWWSGHTPIDLHEDSSGAFLHRIVSTRQQSEASAVSDGNPPAIYNLRKGLFDQKYMYFKCPPRPAQQTDSPRHVLGRIPKHDVLFEEENTSQCLVNHP